MDIFLATLGRRPEAITVALDLILIQQPMSKVAVLHTEPAQSSIAAALADLKIVLASDYPQLEPAYHEIRGHNDSPLYDMVDESAATAYFREIYSVLRQYRQAGYQLHLLVSGGRKAMSVYVALAAALVFSSRDRLWTVLSSGALVEQVGKYHVPPRWRDQVQLVELPLLPARLVVGAVPPETLNDPMTLVERLQNRRQEFLSKLTSAQREVVILLS